MAASFVPLFIPRHIFRSWRPLTVFRDISAASGTSRSLVSRNPTWPRNFCASGSDSATSSSRARWACFRFAYSQVRRRQAFSSVIHGGLAGIEENYARLGYTPSQAGMPPAAFIFPDCLPRIENGPLPRFQCHLLLFKIEPYTFVATSLSGVPGYFVRGKRCALFQLGGE